MYIHSPKSNIYFYMPLVKEECILLKETLFPLPCKY